MSFKRRRWFCCLGATDFALRGERVVRCLRGRTAAAGVGLSILLLAAACDYERKPPVRASRRSIHIAVVGTWDEAPAWDVLRTVAGQIVSETPGAKVSFFAPENRTPAAQQAALKRVESAKVDAVCLLPFDSESIREGVDALVEAGKPVVLLGIDVPKSHRNVFVGPSELEVGQAAAEACARVLPADRQTIMLLHDGLDSASYGVRYAAFKARLASLPEAMLFKEFDGGANGVKSQQIIRRQSRLYPRLGGWVLLDDWPLRRLDDSESLVPLGCSLIVCHDDPRYFEALRVGKINALVGYDLLSAAGEAIRATLRLAEDRADEVVDHIIVPTEVVTQDDVDWHRKRWDLWRKGIASSPRQSE